MVHTQVEENAAGLKKRKSEKANFKEIQNFQNLAKKFFFVNFNIHLSDKAKLKHCVKIFALF